MASALRQLFLNYLVQGCVLGLGALALMGAAPGLLRRYSPRWFCRVWAVLAVLLVLPLGSLPVRRPSAPVQLHTPAVWQEPLAAPASPVQQDLHTMEAVEPAPAQAGEPSAPAAPKVPVLPDPLTLLAGVWLGGAGLFLVWQGSGYLVWRRRALHAARPAAGPWADAWALACEAVPLGHPVPLWCTPMVRGPVTAGLWRPVVLVPEQDPGPAAAGMMLLHERTHLQRRDLALKALLLLARAIHWYNPAVGFLTRRAVRDMEAACDAQVVAGRDAVWRGAYGEALLAAARMERTPALTTGFSWNGRALRFRFARLWDRAPRRRGRLALAAVGLCGVLGVGLIACTPAETGTPATAETAATATTAATPAPAPTPTPVPDRSGRVERDPALLSATRTLLTAPVPGELEKVSYRLYSGTQLGDRVDLAMADGEGGVSFWHSEDRGASYTQSSLDLTPLLGDGPFRVANYECLAPDTAFLVIAREAEPTPGYMTDADLCFLRKNGGDWQLMGEQSCPADTDLGGWHTQPFFWMNENVGFWTPHTDYHALDLWRTVDGGASWERLDLSALESAIPYTDIPGLHTCWAGADQENPGPGHLRVHCNAAVGNDTTRQIFWLVSEDYGETWQIRPDGEQATAQATPAALPALCPLCGGPVETRAVDTREGGLEKRPCIHKVYGEDYIYPNYTVYQGICTQCGQWQSDTWQEPNGSQRLVCHGYQ